MMENKVFKRLIATKWGIFKLVASEKGILSVSFPVKQSARSTSPHQRPVRIPKKVDEIINQASANLKKYIISKGKRLYSEIDLSGLTKMQRQMLKILERIPFGETRSYEWLAGKCGIPKGARAIGQLLGSNPLPVFFPCHRIVRKSGELGGFSGGVHWKKKLLEHERPLKAGSRS